MILLSLVFVPVAFAQPVPAPQREELFNRAYKSLAFFLYMADHDPIFLKLANDPEKKMLREIFAVASEAATMNWLIENKVQRFAEASSFIYAYTITKNRTVQLTTDLEKPIKLQPLLFVED